MENTEPSNVNDIAVCITSNGQHAYAASYSSDGNLETEVFDLTADESLYERLFEWRVMLGQSLDVQTVFRLVPSYFTEQTRIAPLAGEVLLLDDAELTAFLVNAAQSDLVGTDGKPLFETGFERSVYDFSRFRDKSGITLTELPREQLRNALKSVFALRPLQERDLESLTRYVADDDQPLLLHAVETRLRALVRYLAWKEEDTFGNIEADEQIAVFAFTPEGCGFALWDAACGLTNESGEWFNLNFDQSEVPDETDPADFVANLYIEAVINFLDEEFQHRAMVAAPGKSSKKVIRLYWTATDGLQEPLSAILSDFAFDSGIQNVPLYEPLEEMVSRGLLLVFDEESEEMVASVNLANDITVQNEEINARERNTRVLQMREKRLRAGFAVLIPVLLAIGIMTGWVISLQVGAATLTARENRAAAEQTRLKPVLAARTEYEKTLRWYEDILRQIIGLRSKQTAAIGFAARLDPLYPPTDGNSFYIAEMKLLPGGAFEISGLARNEALAREFVHGLEFAEDDAKKRYFTNLTLEFGQGSNVEAASKLGFGASGSSNSSSAIKNDLPTGVSGFLIKGNFVPASAIKAPASPTMPTPPTKSPNPENSPAAVNPLKAATPSNSSPTTSPAANNSNK